MTQELQKKRRLGREFRSANGRTSPILARPALVRSRSMEIVGQRSAWYKAMAYHLLPRQVLPSAMALPIGILLFLLGCAALYAWNVEAVLFLKGALPFILLLWGAIAMLVGYSERKARREYQAAINGDTAGSGKSINGEEDAGIANEPASVS